MKTIKKGSDIKRFDDETADRKVRNEDYQYVSKSEWKQIRDAEKQINEAKRETIVKKKKK